MDRYLAERRKTISPTTLHQDGVAAKAFYRWCSRNDLLDRNPLADYEVRRAPRPEMYMPSVEDVQKLVKAMADYRDPKIHTGARYVSKAQNAFHRERNHAVMMLLIDTAMRIGEALSLKVSDYNAKERQVTITASKGREPRRLPLDGHSVAAVEEWLKVRNRVMKDADEDEGYLFISEFGGKIDEGKHAKMQRTYVKFAGLDPKFTLHSIRRFAINKHAKNNLFAAQMLAGHKNPMTTNMYTKLDAGFMREEHARTDVMGSVFASKREKRKRLV